MEGRTRMKRILLGVAAVLTVALLAALVDAFLYEPTAFVANRVTLHSARLPDSWVGRTILVFSDTHLGFGMTTKDVQRFGDLMKTETPDLVLFLGDCVDATTPDDEAFLEAAGKAFGQVRAPLGKYAVIGNHDDRRDEELGKFRTVMDAAGFTVLDNRSVPVDGILLGGLAESYSGDPDIQATFPSGNDGMFKILLAHQPRLGMSAQVLSYAAPDLVFSGHTHGGQITFFGLPVPVYGTLLGPYISGACTKGSTTVFVTKGVGDYGVKARFYCRPEYVVVTLEK